MPETAVPIRESRHAVPEMVGTAPYTLHRLRVPLIPWPGHVMPNVLWGVLGTSLATIPARWGSV
jgi:hypothetical protein